jgi:hypothetical protein
MNPLLLSLVTKDTHPQSLECTIPEGTVLYAEYEGVQTYYIVVKMYGGYATMLELNWLGRLLYV